MIATVDKVIEFLTLSNLQYFEVRTKDTDNSRVFESDDGKSFEDNIDMFRRIMDISTGNRFLLKAGKAKGERRGLFAEEFRNVTDSANVTGLVPTPAVGAMDIEAMVEKRIEEYEFKQEFKRLKEERDDYKKEAERRQSVSEQFMERTAPYIGTIAQYLITRIIPQPAPIALAGLERENVEETIEENQTTDTQEINMNDDQTERVETALQAWAQADKDFIVLLEKIAQMAAGKDPMYSIAKGMLIK